jgi:predicted ATPase/DNA-binding winged helix-turn-helix (wHTH) protein
MQRVLKAGSCVVNSLSNSGDTPMAPDPILRFERFEIVPAERVLRVDGRSAAIGARAFDLLLALAERRGQLVSKQELLDLVWPGVVVEEHNIAAQMSTLRKLLGADVIATIAGRGYRFVAPPAALASREVASGPAARRTLPEPRTRFIGRDAALADLARLLPQSRLITLAGIGGSGKTRLALEFARRQLGAFAGGVHFVDLAPLHSPERVASAFAAALGLREEHDAALVEDVAAHLAQRELLIVLDNCEPVRSGVAALANAVLAHAGASRIIATSREPLGVPGEQLYRLRGMSLPATSEPAEVQDADAVRLFADRARLSVPEFQIGPDNAAAVAEVCRRLDGIALAIELAAARVALLPVSDIAAHLGESLRLLDGGTGAAAGDMRQRTLLAAIEWSHDQLAPAAQRLLWHTAVFAGGWTLPAATAVAGCADEYETLGLLTALHDHSLITVERVQAGPPRYRMLETVRQFARQRLEHNGATDAAQARHAEHLLVLAESLAPQLRGPQQPQAMARLRAEQENLVAAIGWCVAESSQPEPQQAMRLVAATGRYWVFNAIALGRDLALAALRHDCGQAASAARFQTLLLLSQLQMHGGDADGARAHGQQALALAQSQANVDWQTQAHAALGSACNVAGDEDAALRHHSEALALAESGGNAFHIAMVSNNLGEIQRARGQWGHAEQCYRRALQVQRSIGDVLLVLIVLHNLVRLMVSAGRYDEARSFAIEAEGLLRGIDEIVLKFELLKVSAGLAACLDEHALAARWWGAGSARFVDAGYRDPSVDEQESARRHAAARAALGDAAFAAAVSAGQRLAIEDAMRELGQWLARGA